MNDGQEQRIHYIHGLSYSYRERLVGFFVLLAMLMIMGLIFVNGRTSHLFEERVMFRAYLKNAQGISTDSTVKVSGMEVGKVSNLDVTADNRIKIELYVYKRYRNLLRTDSEASLSKLSLLGKASIDIAAGSPNRPLLPENATLRIQEPLSLDELMAQLTPVMGRVKQIVDGVAVVVEAVQPQQLKSLSADLAATAANLRETTDRIAAGKGAVGHLVNDDKTAEDMVRVVERLASALKRTDERLAELEPVLANTRQMTRSGTVVAKELGALIHEGGQTVNQMNVAMGTVNVELQQLPELVSRMKLLLEQTDRTLQGLQRIWPLSSAVPVPAEGTLIKARPAND